LKFSLFYFEDLIKELKVKDQVGLVEYFNTLSPKTGWFVNEYADKRKFFTQNNARKIQACRLKIKNWAQRGLVNYEEHAVLLASLINSMDKVANTAGTYYAYLKSWHRKALCDFKYEFIEPPSHKLEGACFHEPARSLVKRRHFNVLYLDPPYNQRSYSHYYHLPETIAQELTPRVHGMSGIPSLPSSPSSFNIRREAKTSLIEILDNSRFDLLAFHYADDGIISPQDIEETLSSYGKVDNFFLDSKGYTTKQTSRNLKHHLYLVQNV